MPDVIQEALQTAISGFIAVAVLFVIAVLRQYIEKLKDERLRNLLWGLVEAAEQIYDAGEGAAKYEYVVREAQKQGQSLHRADVEAVVHSLNYQKEVISK